MALRDRQMKFSSQHICVQSAICSSDASNTSAGAENFCVYRSPKGLGKTHWGFPAIQYPGRVRTTRSGRFTTTLISWKPPRFRLVGI